MTHGWSVRRHYTRELLAAKAQGKEIVCSLAPHENAFVEYRPRRKHDPEPWVIPGVYWGSASEVDAGRGEEYRLNGRECHAVTVPGRE